MKLSLLILSLPALAQAAVLTGTGVHLPILGPHGTAPGIPHTTAVSGGTWTGTWASPAGAPWIGTFNVTGPSLGSGTTGTATYDFTTLPSATLPVGTYFLMGDIDHSDNLTFRAWDASGTLMDNWLNDTHSTWGSGLGPGGTPLITDMPGWTWNSVAKTYFIDGSTTTGGNPNLGIALTSNQAITTLEVIKPGGSYSFSLRAQTIPEPSSTLLGVLASGLCLARRKRQAQ